MLIFDDFIFFACLTTLKTIKMTYIIKKIRNIAKEWFEFVEGISAFSFGIPAVLFFTRISFIESIKL